MEIHWKNLKIKNKALALAQSDRKVAKKLNNIKAAKDFNDLVPSCNGRAHFLKGNELSGRFAMDVADKFDLKRYICEPFGEYEKDSSGRYKKETITELIIIKIENDYH